MKKILIVCLSSVLFSGWVIAQSSEEVAPAMPARVIGGVSEGKPGRPLPPKVIPKYQIHQQRVHQKKDHKVIINRIQAPERSVQQPVEPLSQKKIARRHEEIKKGISEVKASGGFFTVSATIYDHKATYVRWSHEGEDFAVWSNVDWNHLGGFHEFEGRGKRYRMMLFSGNTSMKSLRKDVKAGYRNTLPKIPKLPRLSKRGASYMVMKGDESNDAAMEFMEAIHDLYDQHRPMLVRSYREREKNHLIYRKKQEELRRNPPPKPDVIINYWEKESTRKSNAKRGEEKK